MDEEDEHSPSQFSIILNIWKLLIQKLKQASPKGGGVRVVRIPQYRTW